MTKKTKRSNKILSKVNQKKNPDTTVDPDRDPMEAYVNDQGQLVLNMGDSKEVVCFPAKYTPWTPFEEKTVDGFDSGKLLVNSKYQVVVHEEVPMLPDPSVVMTWLAIKRHDNDPCHDWRDFQRIKNEICGKERVGLELYPSESSLLDTTNQYHVFVLPDGVSSPFGFQDRMVAGSVGDGVMSVAYPSGSSKQRSFEEEPEGCMTMKEFSEYESDQEDHSGSKGAGDENGSVEGT